MATKAMLLVLCAYAFSDLALQAQTPGSPNNANTSRSEMNEPQAGNMNPTRTIEKHAQSGSRTLDSQSIQLRGSGGNFEPYQDIERETVKVNATTLRTTTRTFGRDADGARTLVQVAEEERRTFPGGDSSIVRVTSNPDANGRLQVVQRQIEETKKTGKDVEETKTTVMLPGGNGALAPVMQIQERRQHGANDTSDSQRTTLLPDGNGNWQVGEVRRVTNQQDGETRSTDESVSRSDLDGNLDQVCRTVSHESESAPAEKQETVETYSVDVPGIPRDGSLHPVQRTTTAHHSSSTGQQTIEQQVEQPDPGDPDAGLRVTTITIDTASPSSSGTHTRRTIRARDANGGLAVVSVDTTDTRGSSAVQVQIAPSAKLQ